ncbi:hypothetical protein BDN67DRAFT_124845 [Paxillus ammoniavirescens]|nr:hypothetical protein BDN67DRAFT_124845 [Paxillus ammoniavirescens]
MSERSLFTSSSLFLLPTLQSFLRLSTFYNDGRFPGHRRHLNNVVHKARKSQNRPLSTTRRTLSGEQKENQNLYRRQSRVVIQMDHGICAPIRPGPYHTYLIWR